MKILSVKMMGVIKTYNFESFKIVGFIKSLLKHFALVKAFSLTDTLSGMNCYTFYIPGNGSTDS